MGEDFCGNYSIPNDYTLNQEDLFQLGIDRTMPRTFAIDVTRRISMLQIIDNEGEQFFLRHEQATSTISSVEKWVCVISSSNCDIIRLFLLCLQWCMCPLLTLHLLWSMR